MQEVSVVNFICNNQVVDDDGSIRLCDSTSHTLSGNNGWYTIKRGGRKFPPVRVLKQRYVCKKCGGFNFRNLDGSPLKREYTDEDIERLIRLTKQKLSEKNNGNGFGNY